MNEPAMAIRSAMHRLNHIVTTPHYFDQEAVTRGAGVIHYMVELGDQLCLAWEDEDTGTMIVSPIVCWALDNMLEAMGAPWPVLCLPDTSGKQIDFRELGNADVIEAYRRMEEQAITALVLPAKKTH